MKLPGICGDGSNKLRTALNPLFSRQDIFKEYFVTLDLIKYVKNNKQFLYTV